MSIGSILIGAAVILVVGVFLARPFRSARREYDRAIEAWVTRLRAGQGPETPGQPDRAVTFCPHCGRRVGPEDRFCAGCGIRLERS